ncbi:MAG: electron transfer flavoprotein subunit beta/FixA family protein [Eubacterium sp.]|nr:electron transfer flavoprotein subunit beta/FixA family protein [Eubacterium sp.]
MNILVCVKQIPDPEEVKANPKTNSMMLEGVRNVISPYDGYAHETAVRIKEANAGSKVIVLSMGPAGVGTTLRDCVAVGADKAYLVTDDAAADSDTLATSYVLAGAIRKIEEEEGKIDIVFCGKQSCDTEAGAVGPEIAEYLGIPQVTLAVEAEADGTVAKVKKETEDGFQVVEATLPCLITMTQTPYELRYATIKSKMAAKRAKIAELGIGDIASIDPARCGLAGSPTKVDRTYVPVRDKEGLIIDEGSLEASAAKLVSLLSDASAI